jgi:hypothetical protein
MAHEIARWNARFGMLLDSVGSEIGGGGGNRTRDVSLDINQLAIEAAKMLSNLSHLTRVHPNRRADDPH